MKEERGGEKKNEKEEDKEKRGTVTVSKGLLERRGTYGEHIYRLEGFLSNPQHTSRSYARSCPLDKRIVLSIKDNKSNVNQLINPSPNKYKFIKVRIIL